MTPNSTPTPNPAKPQPDSFADLAAMMRSYRLQDLGEGCSLRGLHVLVTMCNVLCALDRCKGQKTQNGTVLPTGLHLLITDPVTEALVRQHVFSHLSVQQRLILRQAKERNEAIARAAKFPNPDRKEEELDRVRDKAVVATLSNNSPLNHLFTKLYNESGIELEEHPLLMVQGAEPRNIARQVARAHQGHALLFTQISRLEEVNALEDIINSLQRGNFVAPDSDYVTEGTVIASVSEPVTSAFFDPDLIQSTWQLRMAWLFHGELNLPAATGNRPGDSIHEAFQSALDQVIQRRLAGSVDMSFDFAMDDWAVVHHKQVQSLIRSSHPEMIAYRPLLGTLLKGIKRLMPDDGFPRGYSLDRAIFALGQLLIAHAKAGFQRQRSRVQEQKHQALLQLLHSKLSDELLCERDIARKCHRITMAELRFGLHLMEEKGMARCVDRKFWTLTTEINESTVS